jgi:hypothetical protein
MVGKLRLSASMSEQIVGQSKHKTSSFDWKSSFLLEICRKTTLPGAMSVVSGPSVYNSNETRAGGASLCYSSCPAMFSSIICMGTWPVVHGLKALA